MVSRRPQGRRRGGGAQRASRNPKRGACAAGHRAHHHHRPPPTSGGGQQRQLARRWLLRRNPRWAVGEPPDTTSSAVQGRPSYLVNLTRSAEGPPGRRGPSSVRRPFRSSTPRPVLPARIPRTRFPERPDWPDPQSQSLSRSYGSRLPISLTYINLSTRGYEPRRPDAEMGTVCVETGHSNAGAGLDARTPTERDAPV